ncbi:aminoglycoside 6-adenylyltransferase [Terribacillus sp. 179-K 1B1 HS]|uniref:aminoglycoside 6-adenylyltransferase n=1 Tax=Terribacillus sp. 179-K 1B1 HS TaxID=3142388 RepID=UPI0039A04980
MRTNHEMMDLIKNVARKDEQIRAVYMNGSKTNPLVPKDIFQDYDIVYVVTDLTSYLDNPQWIDVFGERLMMQEPDKLDKLRGLNVDTNSYGYLMLFQDGNRLDLRLQTIEEMQNTYEADSLTVPILDKDGILPLIPPASDKDYHVRQPSEADYYACTNNFWWCLQNVAKGIWRRELPYAKQMFELVIRPCLDQMANWWIGCKHQFQVSPGKMGKYFKNYLPADYWQLYKSTYSDSDQEAFWRSIFTACTLFRLLALDVASHFSFPYADEEEKAMLLFLHTVKELPADAAAIF